MPGTVLVTGATGFIGFHTSLKLLARGERVVGFDNLNDYYDVALKEARLELLEKHANFHTIRADLIDEGAVQETFSHYNIDEVIHLAAQVGVRTSVHSPRMYIDSNIVGFLNVLESCREHKVRHLVYASSSSVYGSNTKVPYSVQDRADHPINLYAATKRSNELMAHSYAHLFGLPTTGLRFFTVYGPWGRPDMAIFLFARAIVEGRPLDVFNHGDMMRDFTFVGDVVEGIVRVLANAPRRDSEKPATSSFVGSLAPYRLYNIGNDAPVRLLDVIEELEIALDRKAAMNLLPRQQGDMRMTHADVSSLKHDINYHPSTTLRVGIREFVDWFRSYYCLTR